MKAIFILLDTLNRRMLSAYGASGEAAALTPNLDRLARRSVVFDQHWCGSAPCMPARRDVLTGRLNFLEKPWGGMEPFDFSMPEVLARAGIHSQMFSDHAHYLIPGGENYTKGFTAFSVYRGQEGDPVWVRPCADGIASDQPPAGFKGVWSAAEAENRRRLKTELDYPSVRTMVDAAQWLSDNHTADRFMLWVEAFDPHEPYDCPPHYLHLYEPPGRYTGADWNHPDYQPNIFDADETTHLRNRYKALLTMTDRYIGELLDVMDAHDLWSDTLLILTTDHGFHLGEHGYMAKNYMAPYNEVFHIPMMVAAPGIQPGRCSAVTQNIDVLPTVMAHFQVPDDGIPYPLHGRSLWPLLRGERQRVRDAAIFGYFGKQVGWTDGRYVYIQAAAGDENRPLYVYTAIPTLLRQVFGADDAVAVADYSRIEMGRFLSWTDYPVYKIPADIIRWTNVSQAFFERSPYNTETLLFDLAADYAQQHPIKDDKLEACFQDRLCEALCQHDAPADQYRRLGLSVGGAGAL